MLAVAPIGAAVVPPFSAPSCVSMACRSAENDCMKVERLAEAVAESVLLMLPLEELAGETLAAFPLFDD